MFLQTVGGSGIPTDEDDDMDIPEFDDDEVEEEDDEE